MKYKLERAYEFYLISKKIKIHKLKSQEKMRFVD